MQWNYSTIIYSLCNMAATMFGINLLFISVYLMRFIRYNFLPAFWSTYIVSSAFFSCNLTVFQFLESFVRKSNIKEICNFSNRWKCNYPPKHPPPVQLGPDEEEGVHPDVQPPVRVGGVQKPEALRQADSSLLKLFCALGHILPMENTYIIL